MGYRKIPTIYTIEFDGDYQGLIVRMKSASLGKMRALMRALDASGDDDDSESFAVVDDIVKMLVEHLVSWNMEDENGRPVASDEQGLNDQDLDFVLLLSNKYLDQITGPSEDLGKDSNAGSQFPGRPLTMEAL